MFFSAELFLSCSILQFTFYAMNTAYKPKFRFIVLNQQIYYISVLFILLSFLLILNEDLFINNSIINNYFSFVSKSFICLTSILFLTIVNISFKKKYIQNNLITAYLFCQRFIRVL